MLCLQDGKAFLEKNLTEWKKPQLMDHFADDEGGNSTQGGEKNKKGAAKVEFTDHCWLVFLIVRF